ncbi:MAG: hypothetical protein AAF633_07640 [Chloroflexota bacterium]
MNTFKLNKAAVVIWLAVSLIVGYGVGAPVLGLDMVPQTHACGGGAAGGGGC